MVILTATQALPPFGIDSDLIGRMVANFVNVAILAAVLAFLLYRPVRDILRKRTERIQRQLASADEEMTRALELRQEYERKIDEINDERDNILNDARRQAADNSRRLISDAKVEAEVLKERASQSVEMEWDRAQEQMRTAIIDVSSAMAGKFVSLAINQETHDNLLNEAMSDLEGMTWRD
jgi:F-type H+-transporting ATPase subunit b